MDGGMGGWVSGLADGRTDGTIYIKVAFHECRALEYLFKKTFVFLSVYHRLAVNSIEIHVKKGRCPKTFWPGL